jgi:hypothetical protein
MAPRPPGFRRDLFATVALALVVIGWIGFTCARDSRALDAGAPLPRTGLSNLPD